MADPDASRALAAGVARRSAARLAAAAGLVFAWGAAAGPARLAAPVHRWLVQLARLAPTCPRGPVSRPAILGWPR